MKQTQNSNSPLDVVTITLEGELGEREVSDVLELIFRLTHRGVRHVVLDFAQVEHLDYRTVRSLLARAERFRAAGGDIKLCGLSPYLDAIFRAGGAHEAFDVFALAPQARAAFATANLSR